MDVTVGNPSPAYNSIKLTDNTATNTVTLSEVVTGNQGFFVGTTAGGATDRLIIEDNAGNQVTVNTAGGAIDGIGSWTSRNTAILNTTNGGMRVGLRAIDYVEVEIGGQCIDKHYGDWMDIWAGLTFCDEKFTKWERMVDGTISANASGKSKLYVPLQFWFCRNPGLALPLIALQYHEVKLNVQFNPSVTYTHVQRNTSDDAGLTLELSAGASLTDGTNTFTDGTGGTPSAVEITRTVSVSMSIDNCCVFCDYIFLDTDERRRFAQVSHEYLIEQVQYSNRLTHSTGDDQHELRFNHPVKELVWACQTTANSGNNFDYFGTGEADMVNNALLQLNGHDRMKRREGTYFRCVQPFQHHTGGNNQNSSSEEGGVYCYSFGLKPEEHQPSGTCNFSRIDNAVLSLNGSAAGSLKVYAVNYNVLRIMSGMGGLAYSN
jgi:hypothetical protein